MGLDLLFLFHHGKRKRETASLVNYFVSPYILHNSVVQMALLAPEIFSYIAPKADIINTELFLPFTKFLKSHTVVDFSTHFFYGHVARNTFEYKKLFKSPCHEFKNLQCN
jgi:hypothetical protein